MRGDKNEALNFMANEAVLFKSQLMDTEPIEGVA